MEDEEGANIGDRRITAEEFYMTASYAWVVSIRCETWHTLPACSLNYCIGPNAGAFLQNGSFNMLIGPGVGSTLTNESGRIIIPLPNGRLFKADLIAETAEFLDYSDDAACVAPQFRVDGHQFNG